MIPWSLFFSLSLVGSLAALFLNPPQVVDIMRVNVDKVLKRDEILSELDDRADALQMGASQFESSAAKLKRKYWWKNCKVNFLILSPFFSWATTHRRQENSHSFHRPFSGARSLPCRTLSWEEILKASLSCVTLNWPPG